MMILMNINLYLLLLLPTATSKANEYEIKINHHSFGLFFVITSMRMIWYNQYPYCSFEKSTGGD